MMMMIGGVRTENATIVECPHPTSNPLTNGPQIIVSCNWAYVSNENTKPQFCFSFLVSAY